MKLKNILNESSLSRIWAHMRDHDTGVVTACRYAPECGTGTPYTKDENRKRNKLLVAKIFSKGYNITPIKGAYIENFGSDNPKEVNEESYFIVDAKDTGKLLSDLKTFGEEFEQDSVLFIPRGGMSAQLHGTNRCPKGYPGYGNVQTYNSRQLGRDGEFFSKVGNRPFSFLPESAMTEISAPRGMFGRWGASTASKKTWQEMTLDESD